jgi:solute carrier family 8 (sodium/calcium exchanger)
LVTSEPTFGDAISHFLTITWKVLFAIVPPSKYCGGYFAFFVALAFIGIVTMIVGDVAKMLGCVCGIKESVTAITFVAMGTSLPDTFASMTVAKSSDCADSAIGNITGSNSVNIFLGLGLPWIIAAHYASNND